MSPRPPIPEAPAYRRDSMSLNSPGQRPLSGFALSNRSAQSRISNRSRQKSCRACCVCLLRVARSAYRARWQDYVHPKRRVRKRCSVRNMRYGNHSNDRSGSRLRDVAWKRRKRLLPKIGNCAKSKRIKDRDSVHPATAITCIQPPLNKKGDICNHANAPITEYEEANLQDAIILRTPRVNTPSGGLKANHGENRQQDDSESPLTSRG